MFFPIPPLNFTAQEPYSELPKMAAPTLSSEAIIYLYIGMVAQSFILIILSTVKCFEKDIRHILGFAGVALLLFTQSLLVFGVKIMFQDDPIIVDLRGEGYTSSVLQEG